MPWIVLAMILGFALGGSYVRTFLEPRYAPTQVQHTGAKEDGPKAQAEHKEENPTDAALTEYTYWLVIFTAMLAVATIGLGAATVGLYFTGEKQIGLARGQIKLATDTFNAVHRPEIIVHSFEVARDMQADGEAIGAQFVMVNKGTGDAVVQGIEARILMTNNLRPGTSLESLGIPPHTLASGEHRDGVAVFGNALDAAVMNINSGFGRRLAPADAKLWCIGRINYDDKSGRRRQMGFCRWYDPVREIWITESDSPYEYSY